MSAQFVNKLKLIALGQALLATFLWASSKVIIKLSLVDIPPYTLIAAINVIGALSLWIYYFIKRPALNFYFADKRGQLLALVAVVGYVSAPVFSTIALQYISAGTAGLFAAASILLVSLFSITLLKNSPNIWELLGFAIVIIGTYVFLSTKVLDTSMFGIVMTVLAEMGFALSTVLTRFIMTGIENPSLLQSMVGTNLAAIFLIPIALMTDFQLASFSPTGVAALVVLGVIFGFAGVIWNNALGELEAFEAALFNSTIAVQAGILSAIFIGEVLNSTAWWGVALVIMGAVLSSGDLMKKLRGAPV